MLGVTCEGEPLRISICHCLACQKRTGSAFGAQARFARSQITKIAGPETSYVRTAESGSTATFHFCPSCGATVYYELAAFPDFIAVPVGSFADPRFPAPTASVYEARRHAWAVAPSLELEHYD